MMMFVVGSIVFSALILILTSLLLKFYKRIHLVYKPGVSKDLLLLCLYISWFVMSIIIPLKVLSHISISNKVNPYINALAIVILIFPSFIYVVRNKNPFSEYKKEIKK